MAMTNRVFTDGSTSLLKDVPADHNVGQLHVIMRPEKDLVYEQYIRLVVD